MAYWWIIRCPILLAILVSYKHPLFFRQPRGSYSSPGLAQQGVLWGRGRALAVGGTSGFSIPSLTQKGALWGAR